MRVSDYDNDFIGYLKQLRIDGYIDKNFAPLKCQQCDSKELKTAHEYWENDYVVEREVRCDSCDSFAGRWSYGSWEV